MFTASPVLPRPYKIENLLTYTQQTISATGGSASAISGWVNAVAASGGAASGITMTRSTEEMKWTPASLRVQIAASGTHSLISDTEIPVTGGVTYRAFCWVRTRALQSAVRVGIEWHSGDQTLWSSATRTAEYVSGNAGWTLVSFIGAAPDVSDGSSPFTASTARLRVDIPFLADINDYEPNDLLLWFDDFVFMQYDKPDHGFIRLVNSHIPEYMRLLDAEQEGPTYPLLRYLNLVAATANKILNAAIGFDFIPASDGEVGFNRCSLVETRFYPTDDIAEERWLPWLAFITATVPYASTLLGGVATPWYAFENYFSTTNATTWLQLATMGPGSTQLTWSQLQDLNPSPIPSSDLLKTAIRTRGTGILAGTREGLRRAARLALTDGESFDSECAITVTETGGGSATIFATIDSLVEVSVGDLVAVYDSGIRAIDLREEYFAVTSTSKSGGKTFIEFDYSPYLDFSIKTITEPTSAYITNRFVNLNYTDYVNNKWAIEIQTLESQTPDPVLVLDVAAKAKAAGVILTHSNYTP